MIVNNNLNLDQQDSDEIFQNKRESLEFATQKLFHKNGAFILQNEMPLDSTPYKESISTFSNTLNLQKSQMQTTPNKVSRQFKKQNDGFNSALDFQDDNNNTAFSQISQGQRKILINYQSNSSVPDVNTEVRQSKNIVSYCIPDIKVKSKQQSLEHFETFDKQILIDKKSKKQQFDSRLTNRKQYQATPMSKNIDPFSTTLNQSNDFDFLNSISLQMVNGQDSKPNSQYDNFKFQKTQSQAVTPVRTNRVVMQSSRKQNLANFNFTQSQPLFTGEVSVIENQTGENNLSQEDSTSQIKTMNQTNFFHKTYQAINNAQLNNLSKLYQNKQIKAIIKTKKQDFLQINSDLNTSNLFKVSQTQSQLKSMSSQINRSKLSKSQIQQPKKFRNNLDKCTTQQSQNDLDNFSNEDVFLEQDLLQNIDKVSEKKRFGVRNTSQISQALHGSMEKPNSLFMQKMLQKRSISIMQEKKSATELITRQISIQEKSRAKLFEQFPDEPQEMGDLANLTKQENHEQIMQQIKVLMKTLLSSKSQNRKISKFNDLQIAFRNNSLLFRQVLAYVNQITGQEQFQNLIQIDKSSPGLVGNRPLQISLRQGTDLTLQVKIEGKKTPLNLLIIDGLDQLKKQNAKKNQVKFVEKIISPFEIYWSFTNKKPSEIQGEHDGSFSFYGDAFKNQPFFSIQPRGINIFNSEQYQNIYITIQTKGDSNIQADLLIGFGVQFNQEQLQRQIINYVRSQQNKEKQRLESIEKQKRMLEAGISNNVTSLDNFHTNEITKQKNNARLKAFKQNIDQKLQQFMLKAQDREAFFNIVESKKNPQKNVQEIQVFQDQDPDVQEELASNNQASFFDNQNKFQESLVEIEQSLFESQQRSGILSAQKSLEILKKNVTYNEPQIKNTLQKTYKNTSISSKKKTYFDKVSQDLEQTEKFIKTKDVQLYKFNLFMTIRKQLIKSLKDQNEQQLFEMARKIKNRLRMFAQIKLQQIISNLFNNFKILSIRKFEKIRFYLAKYKLQAHFLKVMKWRYGLKEETNLLKQETQNKVNKKLQIFSRQSRKTTDGIISFTSSSREETRGGQKIEQVFESLNNPKLGDLINQAGENSAEESPRIKPLPDYLIKKQMRGYIQPTFRFQFLNTQKSKDIYNLAPKIIQWFLLNRNKKRQIKLKVEQTVQKVLFIQKQYKNYRDKKKRWGAEIFLELEKEKKRLLYFIQLITNAEAKEKIQWLVNELNNLDNKYLKDVAARLIQTIKDLHVIDTYRYRLQFLGSPITLGKFNDIKKTILVFKERLYNFQYLPYLSKYPLVLQKDSSKVLKADDSQDSNKMKKKKTKNDEDDQNQKNQKLYQPKIGKLLDLIRNSGKVSRENSFSAGFNDPMQRYITIQEIEQAYLELNIHMEVYLSQDGGFLQIHEPTINVQKVIQRMQQQTGFMAQRAYIERNNTELTWKNIRLKQDKVYEFSAFRELIIFACIEQKINNI